MSHNSPGPASWSKIDSLRSANSPNPRRTAEEKRKKGKKRSVKGYGVSFDWNYPWTHCIYCEMSRFMSFMSSLVL